MAVACIFSVSLEKLAFDLDEGSSRVIPGNTLASWLKLCRERVRLSHRRQQNS